MTGLEQLQLPVQVLFRQIHVPGSQSCRKQNSSVRTESLQITGNRFFRFYHFLFLSPPCLVVLVTDFFYAKREEGNNILGFLFVY